MDPLTIISLIGGGLQAGQGISSGIKGAQAQKQLGQQQSAMNETYRGLIEQGQGMFGNLAGQAEGFANPNLSAQILGMAQQGGRDLAGIYGGAADALGSQPWANQAAGMFGAPGMDRVGNVRMPGLNQFDFQGPQQMAGMMTQQALAAGERARTDARGQFATQTGQFQEGLGAALADMGMGPQSGAAAAAMGQHARGGMEQMAGLERGIADMAGQMTMQGAQLDASNLLNFTGMGSQYNLGMNQIGQQSALGAQGLQAQIDQGLNQYNLGAAQGLTGLQGLQNQTIQQQAALRAAGVTDPLNMLQGVYQQNFLGPQMGMNQMLTGMAGQLLGGGLGGMEMGMDRQANAAASAGSGKGAAGAGALGHARDAAPGIQSAKGAKPGGSSKGASPIPMPNVGVSYNPTTPPGSI